MLVFQVIFQLVRFFKMYYLLLVYLISCWIYLIGFSNYIFYLYIYLERDSIWYTYVLNYFYMYIYMYLFSCVERERKLYLERHSMCYHMHIQRYRHMHLFLCVERERKYIVSFYVYIYTCTYFHVFGSKVFLIRFQSLYLIIVYPYEILCVIIFNWIQ